MAKVEGHAKLPKRRAAHAPLASAERPFFKPARLPRGYGRKGRKAGTPKPNRSRRRSRSDNTGAAQLRMERAGGLRLLEQVPAVGISWTNGGKARDRARQRKTWRLLASRRLRTSARDRHPYGPKPRHPRVRRQSRRARSATAEAALVSGQAMRCRAMLLYLRYAHAVHRRQLA